MNVLKWKQLIQANILKPILYHIRILWRHESTRYLQMLYPNTDLKRNSPSLVSPNLTGQFKTATGLGRLSFYFTAPIADGVLLMVTHVYP